MGKDRYNANIAQIRENWDRRPAHRRPLGLPIADDAFLPVVVSLQAKRLTILLVIAMAEGERWVRGDCWYEFPV
jgi:hypothetical protein